MSSAFDEWVSAFNEEYATVWKNSDLKLCSMLVHACKKEFKKISEAIDLELNTIRQKLKRKDQLKNRLKLSMTPPTDKKCPNSKNKENLEEINKYCQKQVEIEDSPDIFKNLNENIDINNSTLDNISVLKTSDDDNTHITDDSITSPTIKKKRRSIYLSKIKNKGTSALKNKLEESLNVCQDQSSIKKDLFHTPINRKSDDILESSIIENTPNVKQASSFLPLTKTKRKKSLKNKTLTQMFFNSRSKSNVESDDDITCLDNDGTQDRTDCNELKISEIIDLINDNESPHGSQCVNDKLDNEAEIRDKTLLLPKHNLNEYLAKANNVPHQMQVEETVRGNARKKMPGWACKDCERFYMNQDLPPDELVKKMNECSKHRSKYKPPDETIPGFWSLTLPSQNK